MATFTRRVQTVLSDQQYAALQDLAERRGEPLSVLVRAAVEQTYFAEAARTRRRAALDQLLSLQAPVTDWEQMEAEIARGRTA
jgi:hypothetical protein